MTHAPLRDYATILAKYPATTTASVIARKEGLALSTVYYHFKKLGRVPRAYRPRTIVGTRRQMLQSLMARLNELRQRDLPGAEVCAILSDDVGGFLEKLGVEL